MFQHSSSRRMAPPCFESRPRGREKSKSKPSWITRPCRISARPTTSSTSQLLWVVIPLRWRHNGRDGVSNHQPHACLLNRLFRRRLKKTSKFRVTGICVGNSPGTGDFPAQRASDAENVSVWWRHHATHWPGVVMIPTFPPLHHKSCDGVGFMTTFRFHWWLSSGNILFMCPASKKRRYSATSSLIGWAHTQNNPWSWW